jgi:hypothetical protein
MRWLAVVVAVALATLSATDTEAKRVRIDPPIVRECSSNAKWDAVMTCLGKHGTPEIVRTLDGVKLVAIGKQVRSWLDHGYYIYTYRDGKWTLSGMYEPAGHADLLDFQRITIAKHTGFMLDVGQSFPTALTGITPNRPGEVRARHAVLCRGDYWSCADVMTACEVLVGGRAYFTFRSKLVPNADGSVSTPGDRSRAGTMCASVERVPLGW